MGKESFQQMVARVTSKQASNAGAPPKPPKLSPTPAPAPKR